MLHLFHSKSLELVIQNTCNKSKDSSYCQPPKNYQSLTLRSTALKIYFKYIKKKKNVLKINQIQFPVLNVLI